MTKYNSLKEVPEHILEKVKKYVSNIDKDTYIVTLDPELTGALFARNSRMPTRLRLTLINEFLDEQGNPNAEKGTELVDRVVNGYGDDSVAELVGAHVELEDVSILLTKYIEDRRIGGSPIEQSTRYVKYDQKDDVGRWKYIRPVEIMQGGLEEKFEQVNDHAFAAYADGIKLLSDYFTQQLPRKKFQIEVLRENKKNLVFEHELQTDAERREFKNAYNFTIRCAALDVGRCILPASTLTQVGIYGNGRFFTNLITFLKSQTWEEARNRGRALERELHTVIPTFIKRNCANGKWAARDEEMKKTAANFFGEVIPTVASVTFFPRGDYENEIISHALYPYTSVSLQQIYSTVAQLPTHTKKEILAAYRGHRESRRDRTGRGLEAGYPLTFDVVACYGEYRDLERHRMLTQQRQTLTPSMGFVIPPEISEVGIEKRVENIAAQMQDLHSDLIHAGISEEIAQYATLLNHRMRFSLGMNLRELQHLTELRTGKNGHYGYRKLCMEMAQLVQKQYPWAREVLEFVDYSDPNNKIARAGEQRIIAGKNIAKRIDGGIDL